MGKASEKLETILFIQLIRVCLEKFQRGSKTKLEFSRMTRGRGEADAKAGISGNDEMRPEAGARVTWREVVMMLEMCSGAKL